VPVTTTYKNHPQYLGDILDKSFKNKNHKWSAMDSTKKFRIEIFISPLL
jgi:hypothetical protein